MTPPAVRPFDPWSAPPQMGRTDGGRAAMAAYGRRSLSIASLFSYLGLAIGILGGDLALNWGLYVLIVQRDPDVAPLDDVTPVDDQRQAVAGALIVRSPSSAMSGTKHKPTLLRRCTGAVAQEVQGFMRSVASDGSGQADAHVRLCPASPLSAGGCAGSALATGQHASLVRQRCGRV